MVKKRASSISGPYVYIYSVHFTWLFAGTGAHLEIWDGELAAGGQVGFGNGALEFFYTG